MRDYGMKLNDLANFSQVLPDSFTFNMMSQRIVLDVAKTGVEKIFYFLGPQSNIENFLQVIKLIYTWTHPLYDTNKLLH